MSLEDLKKLFVIGTEYTVPKNYGNLPKGQTVFWDSSAYGTYVKREDTARMRPFATPRNRTA